MPVRNPRGRIQSTEPAYDRNAIGSSSEIGKEEKVRTCQLGRTSFLFRRRSFLGDLARKER